MSRFVVVVAAVWLGACGPKPTPTGAVCPDPDPLTLAYDTEDVPECHGTDTGDCGFGKRFMDKYCIACHDSQLTHSHRNGAPLYHDFDSLYGVLKVPDHIDEQTGIGPKAQNRFMPPDKCPAADDPGGPATVPCPKPTDAEREQMAVWIACERGREHDLIDAGVPDSPPADAAPDGP